MSHEQPGPRWAQQPTPERPEADGETAPDTRPLRRRPKFWAAVVVTYVVAAACGAAAFGADDDNDRTAGAGEAAPTVTAVETVTAEPEPQPTVTETVTAEPEPAVTVTETAEVEVTVTAPAAGGGGGGGGGDDGGGSVHYANCSEARAAGAAPVRVGDPGYGRHLDRDGDGVGCE